MAEDLIRYDIVIQDALRGAVRKILAEAVRAGLPGEHHFYIAFDTTAPGVRISPRLRERYPKEMTIVLQHQFWDLTVTEHLFEVGLSFGGIPEKLSIPFSAIKGFFDPSVQFALEFEPGKTAEELPAELREAIAENAAAETAVETIKSVARPQDTAKDGDAARPVPAIAKTEKSKAPAPVAKEEAAEEKTAPSGADVVSLDAFRKKT
ncbi:hypothetical protein H2509_11650 [Stappia sp. F7233]|uniref:Stringent starvation protein B n=1 Tax=Stappia albiluteola TaxID=2758565 RepID=A0A839AFH0_9HYPH|nr:SspB family protein [Stappia albiluteola]MBA5777778.1 hypothetical protein [Stappia albiluteola]